MGVKSEKETTPNKMSISLYDFLRQKTQEGDDVFGMIALNNKKNLLRGSSPAGAEVGRRVCDPIPGR